MLDNTFTENLDQMGTRRMDGSNSELEEKAVENDGM